MPQKESFFGSVNDLFQASLLDQLKELNQWLSPIVPQIPPSERVIHELRIQLEDLFREP